MQENITLSLYAHVDHTPKLGSLMDGVLNPKNEMKPGMLAGVGGIRAAVSQVT